MTPTEAHDMLAVLRRLSPCPFCTGSGTRWSNPEWDGPSVSAPCAHCEQTGVADAEARPWAKRLIAWQVNDLTAAYMLGIEIGKDPLRARIAELEGALRTFIADEHCHTRGNGLVSFLVIEERYDRAARALKGEG